MGMIKRIEQSDKEEILSEMRQGFASMKDFTENSVEKSVSSLAEITAKGFAQVHERIDHLENELINAHSDVNRIDSRFDYLDSKIDNLETRMNENFAKMHHEIFVLKINNDLA